MEGEKASCESASSCNAASDPQGQDRGRSGWRSAMGQRLGLRILLVLLVIAITTSVFVYRDRVADLETLGYLGAFLVALISYPGHSADIRAGQCLQSRPGGIGGGGGVGPG